MNHPTAVVVAPRQPCEERTRLYLRYCAVRNEALSGESLSLAVAAELALEDLEEHIQWHQC